MRQVGRAVQACSHAADGTMCDTYLYDLPAPVIRNIARHARSRRIPGTNRFALVCHAWRNASNLKEDDEHLQLSLHLDDLDEADLATSLAWLQCHGSCVTGLSVSSSLRPCWSVMEQTLVAPALCSSQLTRLELVASDTLLPLAPHLPKLPCLQLLQASITARVQQQQQQEGLALFCTSAGGHVDELPDIGELCPQLVRLHLNVQDGSRGVPTLATLLAGPPIVEHRLSQLLPSNLQELRLVARELRLDCADLLLLTAVTKLSIHPLRLYNSRELLRMGSMQDLEVRTAELSDLDAASLASKLTMLRVRTVPSVPAGLLHQLTRLTSLCISEPQSMETPPGESPLTALTSLKSLLIVSNGGSMLEGLSSVSSLRNLDIVGIREATAVTQLGQLTQLTGLHMLAWSRPPVLDALKAKSLQQLMGLSILQLDQSAFLACGRVLGELPHLKILFVRRGALDPPEKLTAEELGAPLQGHPCSLQHLVYFWTLLNSQPQEPQEVVPSPLPGVRVTFCSSSTTPRYVTYALGPMRPCPHLLGVWELGPDV